MGEMQLILASIALIVLCSYHDRWIGHGQDGRTIPTISSVFCLAVIGSVLMPRGLGPVDRILAPALFGLAFPAWRDVLPWYLFGSKHGIDARNAGEILSIFVRHLSVMMFLVPAWRMQLVLWPVAGCLFAFAVGAAGISAWNGHQYGLGKDKNQIAEKARGAWLGLWLVIGFVLIPHLGWWR